MAIETLLMDGFDAHISPARFQLSRRMYGYTWGGISTEGRGGGQCLSKSLHASQRSAYWFNLPSAQRTVVLGLAFMVDEIPTNAGASPVTLDNGFNNPGLTETQVCLSLETDGKLALYRGARLSGTEIVKGTTVLVASSWYYLELRVYVDNTAGEYELKIDGVSEFSATSVDTQNVAGNDIGSFSLRDPDYLTTPVEGFVFFDDLYVRGDTVNTAGGFLGDLRIVTLRPNANGSNRDFTLSAGTDDWAVLDETDYLWFNSDYAYSSTAADQITVGMEDVSGNITIETVWVYQHTSIGADGARDLKPVCKSGATTDVGAATRTRQKATILPPKAYDTDPNTGSAWTVANLNAAEFGIEVV